MIARVFYLPADTELDSAAATAVIEELCANASVDDLRILIENGWIEPALPHGEDAWTEAARVEELRAAAQHHMLILFERFRRSLTGRDVQRHRFAPPDQPGLDAYTTGGLSWGEGPTDAFDAWDLVFDVDRFPESWADRIGAAAGLLHPWGGGPPAVAAEFRAWA
ncbi:hypothetical protein [Cryptosporangium arvum]|nr:hypothetical protein [Cryptosporangium arvum]